VLFGLLGAAAVVIGLFAWAGTVADTDGPSGERHFSVEALFPTPGAQAPRQTQVGLDLAPNWTAELTINGRLIPLDQLEAFDAALGRPNDPLFRVVFDPTEGKEFSVLPQGEICVVAALTNLADDDQRAIEQWCFTAA